MNFGRTHGPHQKSANMQKIVALPSDGSVVQAIDYTHHYFKGVDKLSFLQ